MIRLKHFRYRKVDPDLLDFMKLLRQYSLTYEQIAEVCGVSSTTAEYHLDGIQRELAIKRAKRRYQRPDIHKHYVEIWKSKEHRIQLKNYLRERYHNDPEFRKKVIRANMGGRFADKPLIQASN